MQALSLDMGDYSAARRRFDGPFPLPLRYPASENTFKLMTYTPEPVPQYEPEKLPALVADGIPIGSRCTTGHGKLALATCASLSLNPVSSPISSTQH